MAQCIPIDRSYPVNGHRAAFMLPASISPEVKTKIFLYLPFAFHHPLPYSRVGFSSHLALKSKAVLLLNSESGISW